MPKPEAKNQLYLYLAGALLVVALGVLFYSWQGTNISYRAVFLTNNQVFFGKMVGQNQNYITLENVFYIQDKKDLENADTTGDVSLIRAGREVHGPTNQIEISRPQVLFMQTLKDDSKILSAILQYQGTNR